MVYNFEIKIIHDSSYNVSGSGHFFRIFWLENDIKTTNLSSIEKKYVNRVVVFRNTSPTPTWIQFWKISIL